MIHSSLPLKVYKHCSPEFNLLNGCNTIQVCLLKYYRELELDNEIADRSEGVAEYVQEYEADGTLMYNVKHSSTMPDDAYVFCTSASKKQVFTTYSDYYVINDLKKFAFLLTEALKHGLEQNDFLKSPANKIQRIDSHTDRVIYQKQFKYYGIITGGSAIDFSIWRNNIFRKPFSYSPENEVRFALTAPIINPPQTRLLAFQSIRKILDISLIRKELDEILTRE